MELSRVGGDALIKTELITAAMLISDNSQLTLFESQLCRSLKKDKGLVAEACHKYCAPYASVPPVSVQQVLYQAAQKEAKKFTPA